MLRRAIAPRIAVRRAIAPRIAVRRARAPERSRAARRGGLQRPEAAPAPPEGPPRAAHDEPGHLLDGVERRQAQQPVALRPRDRVAARLDLVLADLGARVPRGRRARGAVGGSARRSLVGPRDPEVGATDGPARVRGRPRPRAWRAASRARASARAAAARRGGGGPRPRRPRRAPRRRRARRRRRSTPRGCRSAPRGSSGSTPCRRTRGAGRVRRPAPRRPR